MSRQICLITGNQLTTVCLAGVRCQRCEILLLQRKFNDQFVAFAKTNNPKKAMICSRCILSSTGKCYSFSEQQLMDFLQSGTQPNIVVTSRSNKGKTLRDRKSLFDFSKYVTKRCLEKRHNSCKNSHKNCNCECHLGF